MRPELAKRVKAHYQRQHDKHEQDDDERVVPMLPRSMQAELLTDMYYACLASSPLFMPSHDAALIAATCQYLRREVWQKGDTLIKQEPADQQGPASGGEEGGHGMGVVRERRKPA